jgi:hypothetical protein
VDSPETKDERPDWSVKIALIVLAVVEAMGMVYVVYQWTR